MSELTEAADQAVWGKTSFFHTTQANTSTQAKNRVSHGRSSAPADPNLALPYIEPPFRRVVWAKLDAGGFVIPHIDAGNPFYERWHVPAYPAGFFWEDGNHSEPTELFRVHHWLPHAVYNPTDKPRIHLMVDRDIIPPEAPTEGRLIYTDMIPEVEALIP